MSTDQQPSGAQAGVGSVVPDLSSYDLRLRSLDREPGEPIWLCSTCDCPADWSVWLHTPEWGAQGGDTRVLCTVDALYLLAQAAYDADEAQRQASGSSLSPAKAGETPR
ncbi:MAG: hypothetical protein JWM02_3674 [Frankiales bacterium]|nr:hypothetical protein [Frankiales bacterium]